MAGASQIRLLFTRRFLPYFITQFLIALNDNIVKNALIVMVAFSDIEQVAKDPGKLSAIASGLFILPFFLFSATAGKIGDRYRKSTITKIIKAAEIAIMIPAALGFIQINVPILLFVLFLLGLQAAFFGPVKYGIIPDLVRENEIVAATGLVSAATFIAILLGSILGMSVSAMEGGNIFVAKLSLACAVAGFIISLLIPGTRHGQGEHKLSFNIFGDIKEVLSYVYARKDIFTAICGISWFWFLGSVLLTQFPVFVREALLGDQMLLAVIVTLFTIGIGIGSTLCNLILKGRISLIMPIWAAAGMVIFVTLLSAYVHFYAPISAMPELDLSKAHLPDITARLSMIFSAPYLYAVMLCVLIALCGGLYIVPLYSFIQKTVDPEFRARAVSANNIINSLAMVLSSVFSLAMLQILSINSLILLTGLTGIPVALWLYRQARQFRSNA